MSESTNSLKEPKTAENKKPLTLVTKEDGFNDDSFSVSEDDSFDSSSISDGSENEFFSKGIKNAASQLNTDNP